MTARKTSPFRTLALATAVSTAMAGGNTMTASPNTRSQAFEFRRIDWRAR